MDINNMIYLTQLMNDLFTTGGVLTDSRGAKRFFNDKIKNTDSSKDSRFIQSFVNFIHFIHTELRDNHYCEVRLSDGEIYDIQDSVFCKEYTISPMRLVSRIEEKENDYFETEGSLYFLPNVNKDNYIIRRFPVEILIKRLDNIYIGPDVVSPQNLRSDKRIHYIKSSIQDNIVIAAFILALIQYLGESSYFSQTTYDNYYSSSKDMIDAYNKCMSIEHSLILELKPSYKWLYSRSRLIDKISPFVNSEKYLMSIIDSIVNLPILDEGGKDYSSKKGSPMIPLLDDILYNIFLNDIDQKIKDHLPDVQFTRFQSEIIVPLTYEKYKEEEKRKILEATLKDLINSSFLE